MEEVMVAGAPGSEAKGLSQVERVVDTFVAPSKTFRRYSAQHELVAAVSDSVGGYDGVVRSRSIRRLGSTGLRNRRSRRARRLRTRCRN